MAFQIQLSPSDLTPAPGPFQGLVAEVLRSCGAVWEDEEYGELCLSDGTQVGLFTDEEETVAVFVLETYSPAVADLLHALAASSHSFLMMPDSAWRLPETGGVLPTLALGFPQASALAGRDDLAGMLDAALNREADWEDDQLTEAEQLALDQEVEAAALATAPPDGFGADAPAAPIVSAPRTPLLRRLSDALFGKSI